MEPRTDDSSPGQPYKPQGFIGQIGQIGQRTFSIPDQSPEEPHPAEKQGAVRVQPFTSVRYTVLA